MGSRLASGYDRHNSYQLTLSLIEMPFKALANRADPDQAALVRAV